VVAVLFIVLTLVPGTDISLVWPSEYVILLAWFALGALIYAIAPKEQDESVRSRPCWATSTRSSAPNRRPEIGCRKTSGGATSYCI
jgi:basic amino acid/polyamine antiporter, APA family